MICHRVYNFNISQIYPDDFVRLYFKCVGFNVQQLYYLDFSSNIAHIATYIILNIHEFITFMSFKTSSEDMMTQDKCYNARKFRHNKGWPNFIFAGV